MNLMRSAFERLVARNMISMLIESVYGGGPNGAGARRRLDVADQLVVEPASEVSMRGAKSSRAVHQRRQRRVERLRSSLNLPRGCVTRRCIDPRGQRVAQLLNVVERVMGRRNA